ncbi:MAG TPA: hypothetical protein VEX68_13335 [Bryobacteraceae bacterium]|nr:hypothetical protein [Bryobacteraceae bacterium]
MSDLVGNNVRILDTTLVSRSINIFLTVVSDDDISPPLIESLQFEPSTINVSNAPREVTMRMAVSDEQAGLAFDTSTAGCNCTYNFLTLRSPSGNQTRLVSNSAFRLISGTRNNGVWEGKFTMPRYGESGAWSVESILLFDFLNNDLSAGTASLAAAGLPTGFTIASNPADTVKPTLSGLTFTPAIIDTALNSQRVTVTFVVQDTLSGINFARDLPCPCPILGVEFRSPSGSQRAVSTHQPFTRIAGTNLNGTWTGSVVLQRFPEAGTWNVDLYIKDGALNETLLSADQLKASVSPRAW